MRRTPNPSALPSDSRLATSQGAPHLPSVERAAYTLTSGPLSRLPAHQNASMPPGTGREGARVGGRGIARHRNERLRYFSQAGPAGRRAVAMPGPTGAGVARVQRTASAPNAASTSKAQAATVRLGWRWGDVWGRCMGFLIAGKRRKAMALTLRGNSRGASVRASNKTSGQGAASKTVRLYGETLQRSHGVLSGALTGRNIDFIPNCRATCPESPRNAEPMLPIQRGRGEYHGPFLLFSHWMHMTQDGQLTPARSTRCARRFEDQSRKAHTYYTVMHAIRARRGQ